MLIIELRDTENYMMWLIEEYIAMNIHEYDDQQSNRILVRSE